MTAFPDVQYLDAATYNETSENPVITPGKMEGGYVLTRPRFTRRPRRTFAFSFEDMSDADKNTLQDFWDDMRGSSNGFTWQHPISGNTINVRFEPTMTMKFSRTGYGTNHRWKSDTIVLTEI